MSDTIRLVLERGLASSTKKGDRVTAQPILHIYFLLDRSGSMSSIADDVIGGFNSFLAAQRVEGPGAVMTFVQFDSRDPHKVLADALPQGGHRGYGRWQNYGG